VHDEIVTDVPASDAEEVKHLIERTLTDADTYRVPITWSAEVFQERWSVKG
jgi:DNA polymerase I-like protein with 3'-5' exonuclease and polymerase domains